MSLTGFVTKAPQGHNHAGFSMVEAMLAAGIFAVLAYTSMGAWNYVANMQSRVNVMSDRIAMGLTLREQIDCTKTLAAVTPVDACDSATESSPVALNLLDPKDRVLFPSTFGTNPVSPDYKGRAVCYKKTDHIELMPLIQVPSQGNAEVKIFANVQHSCWPASVPPPPPDPPIPADACDASTCICPYVCCYYRNLPTPLFCHSGTSYVCPGSETFHLAVACAEAL